FRRDAYLCMYCSQRFASRELSRDHIRPFSQGGTDVWTNVVAACRRCNNQKASRTPEQARMQLIAVPFTPTYAEYIFLKGERVRPTYMAVAFDQRRAGSYRNRIYPPYKANRERAPADLAVQFEHCREVCRRLGVAEFVDPDYEADDIIGTLAAAMRGQGVRS